MTRTEIINSLIKKNNFKTYLEIGVQKGKNFRAIECEFKVGVDPDEQSAATICKTSDLFFSFNKHKFDIIFIDGLHEYSQVVRDMRNSLKILNEGGIIVCHDMNPTTKEMQVVPRIQTEWTGDCWKAFVYLRSTSATLSMYVVDTDYGCGIIRKGTQEPIKENTFTYDGLVKNRARWLNLISVEEFLRAEILS